MSGKITVIGFATIFLIGSTHAQLMEERIGRCIELRSESLQLIRNGQHNETGNLSREQRELACNSPEIKLEIALSDLNQAAQETRYYSLRAVAKAYIEAAYIDEAREIANELLETAENRQNDWNYGNAIHDGNMVLGRAALAEGNLEEAIEYLEKSATTPGSPQLNSFGPSMSLVYDLLQAGEIDAVVEYLETIRFFWSSSIAAEKLDRWIVLIRGGIIPDFGGNLGI